MNILYKASATSTGGRDGRAMSSDNALDVKLAAPRELGGTAQRAPTLNNSLQQATRRVS